MQASVATLGVCVPRQLQKHQCGLQSCKTRFKVETSVCFLLGFRTTNVCMTFHKDTASSNLCLQRSVPGKLPALNSAGGEWDKGPTAQSDHALYR